MNWSLGKILKTFGAIFVLAILAWLVFDRRSVQAPVPAVNLSSTIDSIEGWKTYRNEEYGFEFRYPGEYRIYGDLILDKKTGELKTNPQIVELNRDLISDSDRQDNRKEIFVNILQFKSLTKTIQEACVEARKERPEDIDCLSRAITQEDMQKEYQKLRGGNLGLDKVINIGDDVGLRTTYYSPRVAMYYASFRVFNDRMNRVSLEIPIRSTSEPESSEGKKAAIDDQRNIDLDRIISTFRLVR